MKIFPFEINMSLLKETDLYHNDYSVILTYKITQIIFIDYTAP